MIQIYEYKIYKCIRSKFIKPKSKLKIKLNPRTSIKIQFSWEFSERGDRTN